MKSEKRHADEEREEEAERKRGGESGRREDKGGKRQRKSVRHLDRFSDSRLCDRHKANSHIHM